jgi:hypothetical protein
MINLPNDLYVDALGYSRAEQLGTNISSVDRAKLLAELARAGLASATLAKKLDYLNTPGEYAQTPDTMYGSPAEMAALAGLVQDRLMAMATNNPNRAAAAALADMAYKRSQLIAQEQRNAHRDAASTQGMKQHAIALGLITEAEFNARFTELPDGFQISFWATPASYVLTGSGEALPRVIVQAGDLA